MRIPAYLRLCRHGIYYFRIVVPKALRSRFSGRSEVKVSLQTRELREAMLRARNLALAAHRQFRYADAMSVQPVDPNDPSTWPKAGDPNIRKFEKVIETVHSSEGMIERVKYKVDPTSPADIAAARADEILHHKRQRFMRQPNSPEAQAFFEAEEEELRRSLMADAELAEGNEEDGRDCRACKDLGSLHRIRKQVHDSSRISSPSNRRADPILLAGRLVRPAPRLPVFVSLFQRTRAA